MAIAKLYTPGTAVGASGTTLTTAAMDATGYTHVVAGSYFFGATTTFTFTDSAGSTFSNLTQVHHSGATIGMQMAWAKIAGTPGSGYTVTITLGASRDFRELEVYLIDADSGEIALDAEATAQGNGTAVDAGTLSTSGASVVSFLLIGSDAGGFVTEGSGWTEDVDGSTDGVKRLAYSRGPETTSPIDPTGTLNATKNWIALSASFRESTGGGGALSVATIMQNYRNMGLFG